MGLNLVCPEEGSYIGYKKAKIKEEDKEEEVIIKLLITEDALRSSATTRKCRCSKAKVLSITSIDGKENFEKVTSDYDSNFIYEVGKIVEVKDKEVRVVSNDEFSLKEEFLNKVTTDMTLVNEENFKFDSEVQSLNIPL